MHQPRQDSTKHVDLPQHEKTLYPPSHAPLPCVLVGSSTNWNHLGDAVLKLSVLRHLCIDLISLPSFNHSWPARPYKGLVAPLSNMSACYEPSTDLYTTYTAYTTGLRLILPSSYIAKHSSSACYKIYLFLPISKGNMLTLV